MTRSILQSGSTLNPPAIGNVSDSQLPVTAQAATLSATYGLIGSNAGRGLFNAIPAASRNFRKALGRADFIGSAHIAFFQDSIGGKSGANNDFTVSDKVRTLMQRDYPTTSGISMPQSFWLPANVTFFTPVTTLTGTWTNAMKGPLEGFGVTSSTVNDTISYSAASGSSGTRVHYLVQPGGGSFNAQTSTATNHPTTATAGTLGPAFVDLIGADSVKITVTAAGPVTIMGVERLGSQYNPTTTQSTLAGIRNDGSQGPKVSRFSVSGYKIGDLVKETSAVSSLPYAFDYLKPDLSVIALMTNDGDQQTPVATYKASLDTCVARAKSNGSDVLIVGAPPYQSDPTNAIKITDYVKAAKDVAVARDATFLDIPALWKDWVTSNALGMFADGLHPSQTGIPVLAQQITGAIRTMAN